MGGTGRFPRAKQVLILMLREPGRILREYYGLMSGAEFDNYTRRMRGKIKHKTTRSRGSKQTSTTPTPEQRCEWCGNLNAAHTRKLLAACHNLIRQLGMAKLRNGYARLF